MRAAVLCRRDKGKKKKVEAMPEMHHVDPMS